MMRTSNLRVTRARQCNPLRRACLQVASDSNPGSTGPSEGTVLVSEFKTLKVQTSHSKCHDKRQIFPTQLQHSANASPLQLFATCATVSCFRCAVQVSCPTEQLLPSRLPSAWAAHSNMLTSLAYSVSKAVAWIRWQRWDMTLTRNESRLCCLKGRLASGAKFTRRLLLTLTRRLSTTSFSTTTVGSSRRTNFCRQGDASFKL